MVEKDVTLFTSHYKGSFTVESSDAQVLSVRSGQVSMTSMPKVLIAVVLLAAMSSARAQIVISECYDYLPNVDRKYTLASSLYIENFSDLQDGEFVLDPPEFRDLGFILDFEKYMYYPKIRVYIHTLEMDSTAGIKDKNITINGEQVHVHDLHLDFSYTIVANPSKSTEFYPNVTVFFPIFDISGDYDDITNLTLDVDIEVVFNCGDIIPNVAIIEESAYLIMTDWLVGQEIYSDVSIIEFTQTWPTDLEEYYIRPLFHNTFLDNDNYYHFAVNINSTKLVDGSTYSTFLKNWTLPIQEQTGARAIWSAQTEFITSPDEDARALEVTHKIKLLDFSLDDSYNHSLPLSSDNFNVTVIGDDFVLFIVHHLITAYFEFEHYSAVNPNATIEPPTESPTEPPTEPPTDPPTSGEDAGDPPFASTGAYILIGVLGFLVVGLLAACIYLIIRVQSTPDPPAITASRSVYGLAL